MEAILQFNQYKVLDLIYKNNIMDKETEENSFLNPTFNVEIAKKKDNTKEAVIFLDVEIGEEDSSLEYIYVKIAGFFEVRESESLTNDEIQNLYEVNGTAILFPYLRSLVSDLTSKGDNSPIILPTLNISALMQEISE